MNRKYGAGDPVATAPGSDFMATLSEPGAVATGSPAAFSRRQVNA